MRLLNARTYELQSELGQERPRYAILSHTWEEDEVLFEDIQRTSVSDWIVKKGFFKIKHTCQQALEDGYSFVWIDTCCINKDSSAELSEAINSMWRWYQEAEVCYAYLSDAIYGGVPSLSHCRWFGRGWTLQEMIAPDDVQFYDRDWTYLGSRTSLSTEVSNITGIPEIVLSRSQIDGKQRPSYDGYMASYRRLYGSANINKDTRTMLESFSVAQRMKWASKRETTRVEDTAYCLMGLFDVNMPLLYGEGMKAFYRLQAEIIRGSGDHTILAFRPLRSPAVDGSGHSSVLAPHPSRFQDDFQNEWMPNNAITNMSVLGSALSISLLLCPLEHMHGRYIGILDCMVGNDYLARPALLLEAMNEGSTRFWRCDSLAFLRYFRTPHESYCTILYSTWNGHETTERAYYIPENIQRAQITIVSENTVGDGYQFGLPVRLNVSKFISITHHKHIATPASDAEFIPSVVPDGLIGIISFHSHIFEDFFVGWRGSLVGVTADLGCRLWTRSQILDVDQQELYPGWCGVEDPTENAENPKQDVEDSQQSAENPKQSAESPIGSPEQVSGYFGRREVRREKAPATLGKGHEVTLDEPEGTKVRVRVSISEVSFIGRTIFQLDVDGDGGIPEPEQPNLEDARTPSPDNVYPESLIWSSSSASLSHSND